jgi:hypothetical protein
MRVVSISNIVPVLPALFLASQLAMAEDAQAVQQKLEAKYKLTVINAEGGVVITGVTLTLLKGLTASSTSGCPNDYKDGKLSLAKGTCSASSTLGRAIPRCIPFTPCTAAPGANALAQGIRPFVMGEKMWVTKIEVKDSVNFELVSDTINDVVYKAQVRFQFPKGTAPDSAKADQLAGEVFTISQDNPQGGGGAAGGQAAGGQAPAGQTPVPAPAPAPVAEPPQPALAPIAPPPPPADEPAPPPPTVSLGMTTDQVIAILGQPKLVLEPAKNKKIYTYPAFKVTFVDGKVSNIE